MAITLLDGRFIKVNSTLCTLRGYPEEVLLDRRLENIMATDRWRRLSELSRDMLAGKPGHTQLTLECLHQGGKAVRGLLNLAVVADPAGTARYLIVQIQDITREMEATTALKSRWPIWSNRERPPKMSHVSWGCPPEPSRPSAIPFEGNWASRKSGPTSGLTCSPLMVRTPFPMAAAGFVSLVQLF